MSVADVFFKVMAQAILTGFAGNKRIMEMMTKYTELRRTPGSNAVDVPIWSAFTIKTMNSACVTPCSAEEECDDPQATILTVELLTQYVPTAICLSDLNLMSNSQKAGMVAKIIDDLIRDFEVGTTSGVFDTLFTDAVFNGPGGSMTPVVLADSAAGYRQLANAISTAKAKDRGAGISFIGPPDLFGFIASIPDRQIDRMLDGVKVNVVGNSATFACNYWGTVYTGKAGFIYPTDALAYAAPDIKDPNMPQEGYAANFYTTMLDNPRIPGRTLYICHQYGLLVVRRGDIQMLFAP